MSKFKLGQEIKHIKSGVNYVIVGVPRENRRIELFDEPYYSYMLRHHHEDGEGVEWLRHVSEMEDGRFELVER